MGIPRKGSRAFSYQHKDGEFQAFRYLVKETHIDDHKDQKELSITIQEETQKPGNVLQCRWPYGHQVTATVISKLIEDGIKAGWDPSKRGPAVVLT